MSNGDTRVDVSSEGAYHLGLAIDLALVYHTGPDRGMRATKITHWQVIDGKMVFSWHESSKGQPLPAPMGREMLIPLILSWLAEQDYGDEPDHDGSNAKGWRLKAHWELMPDHPGRFYFQFSVQPEWCEYHK